MDNSQRGARLRGRAVCTGVPSFPDPSTASGGERLTVSKSAIGGSATVSVNCVTISGPAFSAAQQACRQLLPRAGAAPPKLSAVQRAAVLANARCMRTHGVPSFPDPAFLKSGGIELGPGFAVNPHSPAFQTAVKACGGPLQIRVAAQAAGGAGG